MAIMIPQEYVVPYTISNTIALALLATAFKWPRVSRVIFVVVFFSVSVVNGTMAINAAEVYLEYAPLAISDWYKNFITGFFSQYPREIVLAISLGQFCIAILLMTSPRLRLLGVIGAMIFFLAIAPLGVGSAFPCSLILAVAITITEVNLRRRSNSGG